jgi:integrase
VLKQPDKHRAASDLYRRFKLLLKQAGLSGTIRFHDSRHSAASLLAQGVPLRVVLEVLGHSSITLTVNTYGHVMPSLVRDATEKAATVLFGES